LAESINEYEWHSIQAKHEFIIIIAGKLFGAKCLLTQSVVTATGKYK